MIKNRWNNQSKSSFPLNFHHICYRKSEVKILEYYKIYLFHSGTLQIAVLKHGFLSIIISAYILSFLVLYKMLKELQMVTSWWFQHSLKIFQVLQLSVLWNVNMHSFQHGFQHRFHHSFTIFQNSGMQRGTFGVVSIFFLFSISS